ncbi:MAG TPA: helix-turn-helix transcriptional regulator, partial [Thermoanaerobaculia bacterium]|nr:helix-turn-helix transcriptional regulator [Thermoanaerobaculia bacterium]
MQPPKQTFGQRLRELREAKDLSLRELAAKSNISPPFLSDIELGRRFPSEETLKALAAALHLPQSALEQYDHRGVVEEVRQRSSTDPQYGIMLRQLLDEYRT